MEKLNGWSAKRAGAAITITHSTGKITGVRLIGNEDGKTVARTADGKKYELS